MKIGEILLNRYVFLYLFLLTLIMILLRVTRHARAWWVESRRTGQGLTPEILMGPEARLSALQTGALVESLVLLSALFVLPFLIVFLSKGIDEAQKIGLTATFIAMLVWVLTSGTDIARSFVSGMAFRILIPINPPFQLNDRVTLKGHSGKVIDIGIFHVRLQTPNDDLICIPTSSLWGEILVSANAGARSSLCVMEYYLMPNTDHKKRKQAEDIIWDAVQASVYYDPGKSLQIYCGQTPSAITLTAKAYVANTYKEPDFKSDVTGKVLDEFSKNDICPAACFVSPLK